MQTHPYRFLVGSILGLLIGGLLAGGFYWAYEHFWARYEPIVLARDGAQIQRLLDQADWISPGRKGAVLYMITYRDCGPCETYQREEFPKLAAAGVDTRVLVFARADGASGQAQSTPAERSTVAELWINRDWGLYQRWMATPAESWSAQGVRSADGDWARSAVVAATHAYVGKLTGLLRENGLAGNDPVLIWRDGRGRLKACACTERLSYHFVRSDFDAPDAAPAHGLARRAAGAGPEASPRGLAPSAPAALGGAPFEAFEPAYGPDGSGEGQYPYGQLPYPGGLDGPLPPSALQSSQPPDASRMDEKPSARLQGSPGSTFY